MSEDIKNTLKGIGLQFFAEGGEEDPSTGDNGSEGEGIKGTGNQSGKTFTQEDVNALLKSLPKRPC